MSRLLHARLLAACLVGSFAATLVGSPPTEALEGSGRQSHGAVTSAAGTASQRDRAQGALAEAKALLSRSDAPGARRSVATRVSGRDATLVLTDLAQHLDDLTAQDRRVARALLARPTYGKRPAGDWEHSYSVPEQPPVCDQVCVHYVTTSLPRRADDAVPTTDSDADGVPDYVRRVAATMRQVWTREVDELGYLPPRSDVSLADHGPGGQLDVYLQDLSEGVYGYCVPDTDSRRTSAYCVLDNDYSTREYPSKTPTKNLQVTAAHEFFHAVQFAYDAHEDLWLMEGTAAWMEDEVYDAVNDNLQYLQQSPLSDPYVSLDYSDRSFGPYGVWVFWRFLSENAGRGAADDPRIVREVWEAAVGPRYSTAALESVLRARSTSFSRVFGTFGTWANRPGRHFSEGGSYPHAPFDDRFSLSRTHRSVGWHALPMRHMSHGYIRFTPGRALSGSWRVRISVDLADRTRGSQARVVVHNRSGSSAVRHIALNRSGNGSRVFGFRRSVVSHVELDLVNASTRFRCGFRTVLSCGGQPYDEDLPARYRASLIR